jgi:hypothetical protein
MGERVMATYAEWMDKYGTLNPEKKTPTENAVLVTLEHDLLKYGEPMDSIGLIEAYLTTTTKGLYKQTHYGKKADHGEEGLEPNSHDNITATMVAFKLARMDSKVSEMWSYIKSHFFTYDFRSPNKVVWERILHPRDIIFYGYLNRSVICTLLLPLLFLMMVHSCKKPVNITSGKLLWWVRNHCLPDYFSTYFHKKVDIAQAFRIYYHQEGHPIVELLK